MATMTLFYASPLFVLNGVLADLRSYNVLTKLFRLTITCYTNNQRTLDADDIAQLKTTARALRQTCTMFEFMCVDVRARVTETTQRHVIIDGF